jgi:hypothetical protein
MRYILITIIMGCILSCGVSQFRDLRLGESCDSSTVVKLSQDFLKRNGIRPMYFHHSLIQNDSIYEVTFFSKDSVGSGGAYIRVSRDNCRVIEYRFYQ